MPSPPPCGVQDHVGVVSIVGVVPVTDGALGADVLIVISNDPDVDQFPAVSCS